MGEIIDNYVDAYFGPKELQQMVDNETNISEKSLLDDCAQLQSQVKDQGFTQDRERYLEKTLLAMETSLRIKNEEEMPYKEQISNLFDINPEYISDEQLSKAVEKLDSVYEGNGPLSDRINPVYKRRELPQKKIYELYKIGIEMVRNRTYELFPSLLPSNEKVTIKEVQDQRWSLYSWYKGNFLSQIDIDTTKPISWSRILFLSAHEGYPGHHTESCMKDRFLYQEQQRFEHCILLIHSPQMVIYEGIGDSAINVLFSLEAQMKLSIENFCPDPSRERLENLIEERIAWQDMKGYETNLAMHIYEDNWTDEQVIKYILELGFTTEERIRNILAFVRDPVWKPYSFNYYIGEKLIRKKYGEHPSPRDFEMLLKTPLLPSDFA